MSNYSRNPSSFCKLVGHTAVTQVATTNEDITDSNWIDVSPFEYLVLTVVVNAVATPGTGTIKWLENASNAASGSATVKDAAGTDLSLSLGTPAAGDARQFELRCNGRKKFVSPQIVISSGTMDVVLVIHGVYARDSAEIPALSTLVTAKTVN